MSKIFLQIINMSIEASYVVLFVMVVRLLLKKCPKVFSYALWAVVLFRFVCSFSFEGIFSFIPANMHVPQNIGYMAKPQINSGIIVIDQAVNNLLPAANPAESINPLQKWLAVGEVIWLLGFAVLLVYSIFSAINLYRKLRNASHVAENVYEVEKIKTPFVFGIIKPRIYIPAGLSETELPYILLHERTHIKRLDYIVKPISFLIICVHWFNPLAWVAFFLMGEDMELSCDESVIKQMGSGIKKEYSTSLLSLSAGRMSAGRIIGACPLAFGENNVKGRIKNILSYKKPALWVVIIAALAILAVILGLITNPKANEAAGDINGGNEIVVDSSVDDNSNNGNNVDNGENNNNGESVDNSESVDNGGKQTAVENNDNEISAGKEVVSSYDKVSAYMEAECRKVFSPYYELLDFQISEYNEGVVDGNVEAVFFYKVILKNYDKDPDTVKYIKEAKERGDKYYQTYYDEYLQPREMNFELKIVIDANDLITLYSNISPKGVEWDETKMSDFILK